MFPLFVKYPEGKPWNFFLFLVALFVCLFVYLVIIVFPLPVVQT